MHLPRRITRKREISIYFRVRQGKILYGRSAAAKTGSGIEIELIKGVPLRT